MGLGAKASSGEKELTAALSAVPTASTAPVEAPVRLRMLTFMDLWSRSRVRGTAVQPGLKRIQKDVTCDRELPRAYTLLTPEC